MYTWLSGPDLNTDRLDQGTSYIFVLRQKYPRNPCPWIWMSWVLLSFLKGPKFGPDSGHKIKEEFPSYVDLS